MKIFLLTHEREIFKASNTGQLVQRQLAEDCQTIIWRRTEPDNQLLQLIEEKCIALLYPGQESVDSETAEPNNFDHFLIIDSTWQQARKMMNKSPYLQAMPRLALNLQQASTYKLRRNQLKDGLCTAETAIGLLRLKQETEQADALEASFRDFNQGKP